MTGTRKSRPPRAGCMVLLLAVFWASAVCAQSLAPSATNEAAPVPILVAGSNAPAVAPNPGVNTNAEGVSEPPPGQPPDAVTNSGSQGSVPSVRSLLWFIGGAMLALAALLLVSRKEPKPGE